MRSDLNHRRAHLLWLIWCVCLALTLLWDASGRDLWAMQALAGPLGFPLQHHPLLEVWLHDRARHLAIVCFSGLWVLALWPGSIWKRPRPERLWLAGLVTLNLLAINLIKNHSLTSCPWDMQMWGGVANHVSHWRWGVADGGPGRCFPGGHVSAALAFTPLVVAAWWPGRAARFSPTQAWTGLCSLLLATALTGGTQTLRGAHYPSHTAWTAVICGGLALIGWSFWIWAYHRHNRHILKPNQQMVL